jgi:hypothetical protein
MVTGSIVTVTAKSTGVTLTGTTSIVIVRSAFDASRKAVRKEADDHETTLRRRHRNPFKHYDHGGLRQFKFSNGC